jgi:hypothetical protein
MERLRKGGNTIERERHVWAVAKAKPRYITALIETK